MGSATFTVPVIFKVIDKISTQMNNMSGSVERFAARAERGFRKAAEVSKSVAKNSLIIGAAVAAPLIVAANSAIKFEDKMADIGKTTGLSGADLQQFGGDLLNMSSDTRTSIDDLLKIGEIGGQLGIAKKDLLGFTDATNKFNVAIGADFSGGVEQAVSQIGSIKSLFAQTRDINIADAISRTGSVINELGAQGSGTSANITDFTLRLGALPDALKPVLTDVAALGAFFEENGIDSQIAAGGLTNFFLVAGKELPAFAAQMHISKKEASQLLNLNPTEFAKSFASSLQGLSAEQLANKLHSLKIGSQETIKVIGALGADTERLGALQNISAEAFAKGTSLQEEYNKKNETTAAKIQKAKNNFEALTITIGTELLPIIAELLKEVTPVIKAALAWSKENKGTIKTVLKLATTVVILSGVVSGIASVVYVVTTALGFLSAAVGVLTAVSWPLVLVILIIVGVIALVVAAIYLAYKAIELIIEKWQEWGAVAMAVLGYFMPPLAIIISLVQSFRRNWDMITQAFKDGGILAGLQAIGATLLDTVLMPLEQILQIIAKVTNADWAASAVAEVNKLRKDLGVNVTTDENGNPLNKPQDLSTEVEKQSVMNQTLTEFKQNVTIGINDKSSGGADVNSDNNLIPINVNSSKRSVFGNG